ncbi:MAG TPA: S1/P1 nuclease, partial [Abditibacteriaceae bacterium]
MRKFITAAGLCLLPLTTLATTAHAWWDGGHMVVAQIAHTRLEPKVRARVDALVGQGAQPRNNTFVTAACWPDDLKDYNVHAYDTWHYTNLPLVLTGGKPPKVQPNIDILWAMNQCVNAIKKRKPNPKYPNREILATPDIEKARALRFLIHLVGDVHQPLHSTTLYSAAHPHGDL